MIEALQTMERFFVCVAMKRLVSIGLALALGGVTAAVASRLEILRDRPYDVDFVPRPSTIRWLSLGHPTLAANFYWLRTVQYIGEARADVRGWEKLFPLADLVTDLDPGHGYAYQVVANVLAGAGRLAESNRILEKGMHNVSNRYILPYHRAVNAMLYEGDYQLAGRYFEKAAATPGAPEHIRDFVVATYVKGNRADAAIGFLSHLLETSKDPESRKAIEKQLQRAEMERAALQIDEAIERYRERFILRPFIVEQLVDVGLLPTLPPDPFGGTWTIDAEGRAHSSVNPQRFGRPPSAEERARIVGSAPGQTGGLTPP